MAPSRTDAASIGLPGDALTVEAERASALTYPTVATVAALYATVGAAALVHEVAWMRIAHGLVGRRPDVDALALAVSLVAVLGGMGFGGLLAPRIARRFGALTGFSIVEGGAALYAIGIPWMASAISALGEGAMSPLASLTTSIALFTPPALAMGAGLPLLAEARASAAQTPRDAGLLYASHAIGGALGGVGVAFVLFSAIGVTASVALAGAAQLAVVGVAFAISRRTPRAAVPTAIAPTSRAARPIIAWLLLASVTLGVGTATLQTAWSRLASVAGFPSDRGFSVVASLYVLALALGAGLAAPLAKRSRVPAATHAALSLAAGLAVLLGMRSIAAWSALDGGSLDLWAHIIVPIVAPVALASAAFPFGVAALGKTGKRAAASDVGWIVAAGALGNVVGVLVTTFVFEPTFGLASTVASAAILLALAGGAAAASAFRGGPGRVAMKPRHALVFVALSLSVAFALVRAPREFDASARATRAVAHATVALD